jgi:hypothetical protein
MKPTSDRHNYWNPWGLLRVGGLTAALLFSIHVSARWYRLGTQPMVRMGDPIVIHYSDPIPVPECSETWENVPDGDPKETWCA